jgi:hypothetical protein
MSWAKGGSEKGESNHGGSDHIDYHTSRGVLTANFTPADIGE